MNVFLLGHVDHKHAKHNFWNFFHVAVLSLPTPPSHFSHIPISVFKSKTNFQITNFSTYSLSESSSSSLSIKMPQISSSN